MLASHGSQLAAASSRSLTIAIDTDPRSAPPVGIQFTFRETVAGDWPHGRKGDKKIGLSTADA